MNELHIYPTSRALRAIAQHHKHYDGFLPSLMRMDEFEQRVILVENSVQVDSLKRILLLQKAASFEAFEGLKVDLSLVRFFTKSEALFKFYEELSYEGVDFESLAGADAYAEFGEHLEILQKLRDNYEAALRHEGYIDRAFIPQMYHLNRGFLKNYTAVEIHLEGYLNRFELTLLEQVAQEIPLRIQYVTSPFNQKMQNAFSSMGISLPIDAKVRFSLTDKELIHTEANDDQIQATVYATQERIEQIALAFMKIEAMVQRGIDPESIALILPDESFKSHLQLFDTHTNLNFAMGYDYSEGRIYKSLEALYGYWQRYDGPSRKRLERYGMNMVQIDALSSYKQVECGLFFAAMGTLGLHEGSLDAKEPPSTFNARVHESYLHFSKMFAQETLSLKEWLFLWLKSLSKITIDDVRGGKITVMGVLETRGVAFEGVVIVDFNEGIVPATSSKDQFLNSTVRTFAKLPTKQDRESLQKQYYKRLLEQAKEVVIFYTTADNQLPSRFLYELGLVHAKQLPTPLELLYAQPSQLVSPQDPLVSDFDAKKIIWSASRLKTYLECKRKYYYRYIQKIEPKPEEERNEGAFLHHLLDHLFRDTNRYTSEQELAKAIDLLLAKLLPEEDAKSTYQKLLWREKLKGFIASQITHFESDWQVIAREREVQGEIGGLQFKGRIDRMDQNPDEVLVLDYKTGSTKEAQKTKNLETLTDFQMSIYHYLLSPQYGTMRLAFVKLFEEGTMEEITLLEEKNQRLGEIIVALKQTQSFVAARTEELQKCKFCEFQLMCERGAYL